MALNQIARDLIAAFQAGEAKEAAQQIMALAGPDGLDHDTARVLAAWMQSDHRWHEPETPCPDGGRATARAYAWLMSGAQFDYEAIADAANVRRATAREKVGVLLAHRLIYPDGQATTPVKQALAATAARAVKATKRKAKQDDEKSN